MWEEESTTTVLVVDRVERLGSKNCGHFSISCVLFSLHLPNAPAFLNGIVLFAMSDQPPQGHASVSTPGSKSSREAELEELRRQSLAQSNAQKLGTFLWIR
jgi:hypothetical protein